MFAFGLLLPSYTGGMHDMDSKTSIEGLLASNYLNPFCSFSIFPGAVTILYPGVVS